MIGLIQRVTEARVEVDNRTIAQIGRGLLALIGVEKQDDSATARRLAQRIIQYRIFPDADGKMNLSLQDTASELLLVPQFTLPADTRKGNRPSFSSARAARDGSTPCSWNLQTLPGKPMGRFKPASSAQTCRSALQTTVP